MTIWVDAHISPRLASWINEKIPYEAYSLRRIGLRDANNREIYEAARSADAVIISKDSNFLDLIGKYGSPPRLIYLRCGNTTNQRLREILGVHLQNAMQQPSEGETVLRLSSPARPLASRR